MAKLQRAVSAGGIPEQRPAPRRPGPGPVGGADGLRQVLVRNSGRLSAARHVQAALVVRADVGGQHDQDQRRQAPGADLAGGGVREPGRAVRVARAVRPRRPPRPRAGAARGGGRCSRAAGRHSRARLRPDRAPWNRTACSGRRRRPGVSGQRGIGTGVDHDRDAVAGADACWPAGGTGPRRSRRRRTACPAGPTTRRRTRPTVVDDDEDEAEHDQLQREQRANPHQHRPQAGPGQLRPEPQDRAQQHGRHDRQHDKRAGLVRPTPAPPHNPSTEQDPRQDESAARH